MAVSLRHSVTLVGLPGSDKTTVGRQLARRLQLPFVYSDQVIEQRLRCSIRDYFEREGEESFRDVEQAVIDELTQVGPCVLSTGGGAVIRSANRNHMRQRGKVVTSRWPEKNRGDWSTVVVRKLTVP